MYESKYEQFPDNFSLEKRMENGESLIDIFDDVDYNYKCWGTREAPNRPITVRIKGKFNYVVKGSLLFENWFTSCRDFEDFDDYSYAYRDVENGYITRGVFFDKFGKFIIKEEFNQILYGNHNGGGKYAIVKQKNGKLNIVDLEKGIKSSEDGLGFDAISVNNVNYDFDIFIVEEGIKNAENWSPGEVCISKYQLNEDLKGIKYNFYKFGVGLLSNEWFDLIDPFEIASKGYIRWNAFCAVVYKNNKCNFINQKGELLSSVWFDIAHVFGIYGGDEYALGGILKSQNVNHLSDWLETDDYFGFNPQKFDLYEVGKNGKLTKK